MSNVKPDGPYVYQPFGMKEREHWNARRIYAVGGMDRLATLTGLTEGEAYSVVDALRGLTRLARVEAENKGLRDKNTLLRHSVGRLLGYLASLDLGEKVNTEILEITEPVIGPGDSSIALPKEPA